MEILGLDVGTRTIKGVLARRTLLGLTLRKAFVREVDDGPLSLQIQRALEEEAPGTDLVVLSIPRDLIITRNLELPFKDLKKVKLVVPAEAERNLPFTLKDAVVAHTIADPEAPNHTRVMAFVAHKKDLAEWTVRAEGIRSAEYTAAIDSLGMVNAYLYEDSGVESVALVDLGAKKTSIEVIHKRRLVYSRVITVAGETFTTAIASGLKIGQDEAEQLKRQLTNPSGEIDSSRLEAARTALAEAFKRLVRELNVTVLSARNLWPALELERVVLCGGAAVTSGLVSAIGAGLSLPTALHSSPMLGPLRPEEDHPALMPGFGLALSGARKAVLDVDLLNRPTNVIRYHKTEIGLLVGLVIAILIGGFVVTRRELASLREQYRTTVHELDRKLERIGKLTRQPVDVATLNAKADQFKKLRGILTEDCASRLALLNDISRALPEGLDVTLLNLSIDQGRVELEGMTDSFETLQKVEEAFKAGLKRPIDVRPPRNETRDDKPVTVFRLHFAALPADDQKGGGKR
ncbi:MAG: pilus assembly protein PilM [Candidatus Riflebacteria bacterium]|nr:pilus assembly protein PilM [Candidatus Riflebacteria bacterium]